METSWSWGKAVFLNFQSPKVHLKLFVPGALTVKGRPRQLVKPTLFSNYASSMQEGGCAGRSPACSVTPPSGGHPAGTMESSHGTVASTHPGFLAFPPFITDDRRARREAMANMRRGLQLMKVFHHSSEGWDHCLHFWTEYLHFSPLRKASLYAMPSPHGSQ